MKIHARHAVASMYFATGFMALYFMWPAIIPEAVKIAVEQMFFSLRFIVPVICFGAGILVLTGGKK